MFVTIIDLPDTESLKQIREVLIDNKWIEVKDTDELCWKKIEHGRNKVGIKLSFNDKIYLMDNF